VIGVALVAVAVAWNAGPGLIVTADRGCRGVSLYAYENVEWFRNGVQTAFVCGQDRVRWCCAGWRLGGRQDAGDLVEDRRVARVPGWSVLAGRGAVIKLQIDLFTTAGGWLFDKLQAIWTSPKTCRSFLAGAFSLGIGIARQAFEDFLAPIKWVIEQLGKVYDEAKKAYDMVRQALGQDVAVSLINALPGAGGTSPGSSPRKIVTTVAWSTVSLRVRSSRNCLLGRRCVPVRRRLRCSRRWVASRSMVACT
jgi:hypothetical protein